MSTKTKYPYFDSLELLLENDFLFKPFKPLIPVKAGNNIPEMLFSKDFGKWQQYVNGAKATGPIPFAKFNAQPLVVAFYSQYWGQAGITQLLHLNKLHHEVKAVGGNLVVVIPHKETLLPKLAWKHELTLTFYNDQQNDIARQFRVFNEDSPAWNLFTGVDENVPLLATYVLNAANQILYDHLDLDLSDTFAADEVLNAVHQAAHDANGRRSA
ncbi:peroxiredoxin [Mucilaginibacter gracilis]|uniref:Peroxiredoxin n=1 Tax=Mucilaginibacter gracilis TaxID=423350 RepID=A0A495IUI8_9SPHI|nr:redoxin domain-containing protein [Mucilaginibacter gracilis]RKR80417.1 peroxiredoxin [Mucilaginibacter gracilis]